MADTQTHIYFTHQSNQLHSHTSTQQTATVSTRIPQTTPNKIAGAKLMGCRIAGQGCINIKTLFLGQNLIKMGGAELKGRRFAGRWGAHLRGHD